MLLNEISNNNDELIAFIKENCKQYFKQTKSPVFRGMKANPNTFIYQQRSDRKPRDSREDTHQIADEYFKEKFGHPYRSDVTFVVGYMGDAEQYGLPHYVIPIGDFTFCWSPKVRDLTEASMIARRNMMTVSQVLEHGDYTTKNLDKAVDSEHEIMLNAPNGYVAFTDHDVWDELV